MISVIVPVYNVENYLRKCIDSIICQTYEDLEIILVDDGSTDMSPIICDEYAEKDARVRTIHKKNGGLSAARNTGIEAATGEFIGFVDSDDYILPQMYETLYRACVNNNTAIAMCGNQIIDAGAEEIQYEFCTREPVFLSDKEAIKSLLTYERCDPVAWNKLYRKVLFSEIRYPLNTYYEDQIATVQLFYAAGGIFHVGKALYVHVKRSGSITALPFNPHSMDEIKQAELVKGFVDRKYPELKRESLYYVYYKMGFILLKASQCHVPEMKKYMKEVCARSACYLPHVLAGNVTVRHKCWFLINYIILRARVWK